MYKFSIVQIFVESERVYNDNYKFRKKANSNYELTINFSERNKNAGDGARTHDLQISEVKRNR